MNISLPVVRDSETAKAYRLYPFRGLNMRNKQAYMSLLKEFHGQASEQKGLSLEPAFSSNHVESYDSLTDYVTSVNETTGSAKISLIQHVASGTFVGLRLFYKQPFQDVDHREDIASTKTYIAPSARKRRLGLYSIELTRRMARQVETNPAVLVCDKSNIASLNNLTSMCQAGLAKPYFSSRLSDSGKQGYQLSTDSPDSKFWKYLQGLPEPGQSQAEPLLG